MPEAAPEPYHKRSFTGPLSTTEVLQNAMLYYVYSRVMAKGFRTTRVFPLNPIVNKSCKIDCCDNKASNY